MPVPSAWTDISDTASANSPPASESVGPDMNAYIQAAYAYAKQLYEGQMQPTAALSLNSQKISNLAAGVAGTDAVNVSQLNAYLVAAGGWTVTGPVAFTSTAAFTNSMSLTGAVQIGGAGTLNVVSNNIAAVLIQSVSGVQGANIDLHDVPNGGRKYLRCAANQFQIVNAAYSTVLMTLDESGNITTPGSITASGNITAYSDERLKKDWVEFDDDFIDQLSVVKAGSYTRIDSGDRQVGVSAQSLQKLMPEAVDVGQENGMLSVAYGHAALAACVKLAQEVVSLRRRIEELEGGE